AELCAVCGVLPGWDDGGGGCDGCAERGRTDGGGVRDRHLRAGGAAWQRGQPVLDVDACGLGAAPGAVPALYVPDRGWRGIAWCGGTALSWGDGDGGRLPGDCLRPALQHAGCARAAYC